MGHLDAQLTGFPVQILRIASGDAEVSFEV